MLDALYAGCHAQVPTALEGVLQAASEAFLDRKGHVPRLTWWRSRLADIDGSYGPWARKTRRPALILLGNVDDALRERFLVPFVDRYAHIAPQRPRHGPAMLAVVFASSLGRGSDPDLTPTTVEAPWSSPELRPPHTWLLHPPRPSSSSRRKTQRGPCG
ncbi:hypothetical protein [Streptomyces sp. NPDC059063]|uniref:hypothetical protein n=1 Tax=unclassified Streptomyces TaxID=2593676 RepID=UPI0036B53E22